jgi:prepilin-type N-terminal cleavage/methylation domain-containing protein
MTKKAFTLIELIVVVVIMSLTATITIHYLTSASRLYTLILARRQADSEVLGAVNRMRREARLAESTTYAASNAWTFIAKNIATNTYTTNAFSFSGNVLNLNNNLLAKNLKFFRLSYYSSTNGLLTPLPLSATNCARIGRVALSIMATNATAESELYVNFFIKTYLYK